MSTRDLKHPWKPSVWIDWICIVLGSWLLQGIRICVKEPYFTILGGKLCRIRQDHAEPGEKQDHRSDRKLVEGVQEGPVLVGTLFDQQTPKSIAPAKTQQTQTADHEAAQTTTIQFKHQHTAHNGRGGPRFSTACPTMAADPRNNTAGPTEAGHAQAPHARPSWRTTHKHT